MAQITEGTIHQWAIEFDVPYEYMRRLIKRLQIESTSKLGKQKIFAVLDWNDTLVKEIERYKSERLHRVRLTDVLCRIKQLELQVEKLGKALKLLIKDKT